MMPPQTNESVRLPSLDVLGRDLLQVSPAQRLWTIGLPFLLILLYFIFANLNFWLPAFGSVVLLSMLTYGSSSHDLVHQTLGLSKFWNHFWLSLIEIMCFRSGTAYRLSHLHHHRNLLDSSDIEGSAVRLSLFETLFSGPTMQIRLWYWASQRYPEQRNRLLAEAVGILALVLTAAIFRESCPELAVYAVLTIGGSWFFPLVTVYLPHSADGDSPLTQTRLFRGLWYRIISLDHLYHLEHHLYPAVPHHHWRRLALRLDPWVTASAHAADPTIPAVARPDSGDSCFGKP
jgi:beta-carotene hydroxylase